MPPGFGSPRITSPSGSAIECPMSAPVLLFNVMIKGQKFRVQFFFVFLFGPLSGESNSKDICTVFRYALHDRRRDLGQRFSQISTKTRTSRYGHQIIFLCSKFITAISWSLQPIVFHPKTSFVPVRNGLLSPGFRLGARIRLQTARSRPAANVRSRLRPQSRLP